MDTQTGLHLPATNPAIYTSEGYRVRHTNEVLSRFGFQDFDRDLLFKAYGKDTVVDALGLYFGAKENPIRSHDNVTEADIRSGLVATMELMRTRGKRGTEQVILDYQDPAEVVREKYQDGRKPTMRVRDDDNDGFALEGIEYLIDTHVLSN